MIFEGRSIQITTKYTVTKSGKLYCPPPPKTEIIRIQTLNDYDKIFGVSKWKIWKRRLNITIRWKLSRLFIKIFGEI